LHLWDREARVAPADLGPTAGAVSGLGFVRGGHEIVVADLTGRLSIREHTSAQAAVLLDGYPKAVGNRTIWDVAVMRDALRFVTGDGIAVRVWDARSRKQIASHEIDAESVRSIAVDPGGDRIAFSLTWYSGQKVAAGDHLHLWDWATGRIERATWATRSIRSMDWSPGGNVLALALSDGKVQIYDIRRGTEVARINAMAAKVAFSPDGTILAGACDDGTVQLWHAAYGHEVAALRLGTKAASIDWARDGALLAVGFDTYWAVLRLRIR
jgi:WD40 repeat protein